jgi:hypothetical protein
MDVLCVGMYRACSTWQYELAAHLVEQRLGGRRLGYVTGDDYAALLRLEPRPAAPRVLKCHEGHPAFYRALRAGRAIPLYAYRDARDVVYSMLHKRQTDFTTFLRQGMVHQILANDRHWRRHGGPRLLVQQYERIVDDPVPAVRALAAAIDLPVDDPTAAVLASEYSFESNRKRANATAERLKRAGLDLDDPANAIVHDNATLLHWNHLRTGRVGDWRDRATPAERYVLNRLLGRWLQLHGYAADDDLHPARRLTQLRRAELDRDIRRGWLACALRCAAHDYPRTGRLAKRLLGIDNPRDVARPATAAAAGSGVA